MQKQLKDALGHAGLSSPDDDTVVVLSGIMLRTEHFTESRRILARSNYRVRTKKN